MFWIKQYCKSHNLEIKNCNIMENNIIIGKIDFYDEFIEIKNKKYKFGDIAHVIFSDIKIH